MGDRSETSSPKAKGAPPLPPATPPATHPASPPVSPPGGGVHDRSPLPPAGGGGDGAAGGAVGAMVPVPAVARPGAQALRDQIACKVKRQLEELVGEDYKSRHKKVCALREEMVRKESELSMKQYERQDVESTLAISRLEATKAEQNLARCDVELTRIISKYQTAKDNFTNAHASFRRDVMTEYP